MKHPLISVIVLNYNGLRFISNCLNSIINQDYANLEIIVVDNASEDGSLDVVRRDFPDVKIIKNRKNLGFCAGNNIGILRSKGQYLVLVNMDVVLDKKFISESFNLAESDHSIGAIAAKIYFRDGKTINHAGGAIEWLGVGVDRGFGELDVGQYDEVEDVFFACGAAMFLRREVLKHVGMFDPTYFCYSEDLDLCWRMKLAGYRVVYSPKSIAFHEHSVVMGAGPSFKKHYLMTRNFIKTVLKNCNLFMIIRFFLGYLFNSKKAFQKYKKSYQGINYSPYRLFFAALIWNLKQLPVIIVKHRRIQKLRKISDEAFIFPKMIRKDLCFTEKSARINKE